MNVRYFSGPYELLCWPQHALISTGYADTSIAIHRSPGLPHVAFIHGAHIGMTNTRDDGTIRWYHALHCARHAIIGSPLK